MTGEAGFLERIPWLPEEAKFLLISLIPQPLGTQLMAATRLPLPWQQPVALSQHPEP
jgi:hypothetical protein